MAELAAKAREEMTAEAADDERRAADEGTIAALPSPPRGFSPAPPPVWADLDVDPSELVVIVGGAELGPYGSSRTRFEMEVDNELSAAGVLELAWTTGLIKWEDDPTPGWYDTESGDLIDEAELVERYHDVVVERVGIREFVDDGAIDPDHASPLHGERVPGQGLHVRRLVGGRRPRVRSSSTPSTRWSGRSRAPATGRLPARRAPRFACRARPSCRGPSARRSPPGSTRRCSASAKTWPARSTGWRCGTSWRPSTRSCRRASPRPS